MSKAKYCPECQEAVTDEECPHWDYEFDPRDEWLELHPVTDETLGGLR